MKIEFDRAKDAANIAKHGISLALAEQFDFDAAIIIEDNRRDYGEKRFIAFGEWNRQLYTMIYTIRGANRRIISFRRAHEKERKRYDQEN